jgi:hypothetical protein
MGDPSIILPAIWIARCAIHNPRDIIDEEPIRKIDYGSERGIHNAREIIDEGHIYNVPRIMDCEQR